MAKMSIEELHRYIDLLESNDKDLKQEAETKVALWERDVAPDQTWVAKDNDNIICHIVSVNSGKVSVVMSNDMTNSSKKTFFGFGSFLKNWRRLV